MRTTEFKVEQITVGQLVNLIAEELGGVLLLVMVNAHY